MKKFPAILAIAFLACGSLAFGQADQTTPFRAGISLGTDVFLTGPGGTAESWTQLGFQPDVAFGKVGVGLNLSLHFQLYPVNHPDQAVAIYGGDWYPLKAGAGFGDWLDLYLPKILYVRYGLKGEDPLFVKVGSIGDFTLGNGFIMGYYSNMSNFPQTRILGFDAGIDGSMFDFPYLGLELMTDNLARFDVLGLHLLGRPLIWSDLPLLKNLQVGFTLASDLDPSLYSVTYTDQAPVSVYGFDALLPLLGSPALSMAAFTEAAMEPGSRAGFMLGFGGKLIGLFTYGAQLRLIGAGFIPTYFDANYDLYRDVKASLMAAAPAGDAFAGWYASIGADIFGDKLSLLASLDGPFGDIGDPSLQTAWPHLRAVAHLGEGILPGVYADATYEKYMLGAVTGFFSDLTDPTDAIVGLAINYRTGSSVLTLLYNAKWLNNDWKVTSSLQASLKF